MNILDWTIAGSRDGSRQGQNLFIKFRTVRNGRLQDVNEYGLIHRLGPASVLRIAFLGKLVETNPGLALRCPKHSRCGVGNGCSKTWRNRLARWEYKLYI